MPSIESAFNHFSLQFSGKGLVKMSAAISLVSQSVLDLTEAEFKGHVVQPSQADVMAPLQVPHSGRMTRLPCRNASLVILLENKFNRPVKDNIKQVHKGQADASKCSIR